MEFYNQICIERLREIMNDNLTEKGRPLKPADLHRKTGVSQKHLSNILTDNKPLTPTTAAKIISAFPEKRYCVDWLLGKSEYKTEFDREQALRKEVRDTLSASATASNKKRASVLTLMELLGAQLLDQDLPEGVDYVIPSPPAATYNGVTLTGADILHISDKLLDLLSLELEYIARERLPLAEYVQHYGRDVLKMI